MFKEQIFSNKDSNSEIPESAQIVFVSDMFVEDYVGGAELTTEALIKSSPFSVHKIKSRFVTMDLLQRGMNKFWIFGNFAEINPQLIPTIIANLKYSVLEYDYKFCKFRSPEKHFNSTGTPCDCANQISGKLISAFYYGSMGLWWMSEKQRERYVTMFPFLSEKDNIVLSSVFDHDTLGKIEHLNKNSSNERKGWIVLGSNSWVKGAEASEKWCKNNQKDYEVVWNLPYDKLLAKLSISEGFVYLPAGADTCPRMVIEAKLLGCKLILNDNVQHKDEEWFNTNDIESIKTYLYSNHHIFWSGIRKMMEYKPEISGYTTTYNCVKQEYPFIQSIMSMVGFCDEICVVDGGSTDGTWEALLELSNKYPNVKLKQIVRDWSSPRHAIFDGMQKAEARTMCTKEFCWQMDTDEVVHESDYEKIVEFCKVMPKQINVLALPVIEYWGGPEKVRLDIQPWKWRLSRNLDDITHGIPNDLRKYDNDGNLYASEGTDGCDMIHKSSGERCQFVTFHNQDSEALRRAAMMGNVSAIKQYESWFSEVINDLPSVFHYSWYDLTRKIKLYKNYWTKHWNSLYNKSLEDTAETNMMFDVPWSQVTKEMIEKRALELKEKTGGWIWHRKWDGTQIPHIVCNRSEPKVMK